MATDEYGLSADGFKRKRLPEIKADIEKRMSNAVGVPIQTRPDSVFGQVIGVFSYDIAQLWELAEKTYYAMYPNTAAGVNLTNAATLAGIRPVAAEQTSLYATCYGSAGTSIPYGSQIRSRIDSTILYSSMAEVAYISTDNACYAEFMIDNVVPGTAYELTVSGQNVRYTAQGGDSVTQALAALGAGFSFEDKFITLNNEVFTIRMNDESKTFAFTYKNLTLKRMGSPVLFQCDTFGSVSPVIGEVNQIVTQIAGWTGVENNVPAIVGRDAETDISLRQRWSKSVYSRASAMTEAIQANIYDKVEGVWVAMVYENREDIPDTDGRPPHSIEVVVGGGVNEDIARQIWINKAPGIDTYGTETAAITDSQGILQTMRFNRPENVYVWLRVQLTKNPDEEWAGNTQQAVAEAVLKKGQEYKIGEDVILQRFIGSIYDATIGIGVIRIYAATGESAGTYSENNIVISPRQVAVFTAARIEVFIDAEI